jgi:signal transduction histidine kinase
MIVYNLLNNAIKFSFDNNKIEIQTIIDHDVLTIKVRDYGIGIKPNEQQIIYDRFRRLNDTINSINTGHGLGLSVAKAYLDMLRGTIDIQSLPNEGTTFSIFIPDPMLDPEAPDDLATDANEIFFGDSEIF